MFKQKRGNTAAGAAILLVIITGLIIMFVILMSPQERAELLGDSDNVVTSSNRSSIRTDSENLLKISPGRIDYLTSREIEHPLPVINIFTTTDAEILAEKSRSFIKRSVFAEENSKLTFLVDDLRNTENILLSFSVSEGEGRLLIHLNGEELYNAPVQIGNNVPLSLNKGQLQSRNDLVFSVSSPGIAIWATNEISLDDVKVIADVTNKGAQSSRNVFLVSETEKSNLERVLLKFQPTCNYGQVGTLRIDVNGDEIYASVPDCDVVRIPIEFSPSTVNQGENQITFRTEEGSYLLSHVVLESKLQSVEFPVYFFDISNEEFEDVRDGDKDVQITIDFVDVIEQKVGDFVFNGHLTRFDTRDVTLSMNVSEDIVRGNNALKIKPRRTLDVRQLRIDLVD